MTDRYFGKFFGIIFNYISRRFGETTPLYIGSENQNPVQLNAHDWMTLENKSKKALKISQVTFQKPQSWARHYAPCPTTTPRRR